MTKSPAKNKFTTDYFIEKFSLIPENHWCVEKYAMNQYKKCALGHCGESHSQTTPPEAEALMSLFYNECISEINDGKIPQYQQDTPKQRVLAALFDVKKSETSKLNN